MNYEILLDKADKDNLKVKELSFTGFKGLCKGDKIGISKYIETSTEKACILAEELGHHHTTVGNILDLSQVQNRKQERQARNWAYNEMMGLCGLIKAYKHGCRECHEIAEYLDVTEEFLCDAIECYRDKHGVYKIVGNHIIYFIPNLMIGRML